MFESVAALQAEHDDLQRQLSDPALHSDPARSKRVNRRYAELSRIVAAHTAWSESIEDLLQTNEVISQASAEDLDGLTLSIIEHFTLVRAKVAECGGCHVSIVHLVRLSFTCAAIRSGGGLCPPGRGGRWTPPPRARRRTGNTASVGSVT